jgi:hypothetical protein
LVSHITAPMLERDTVPSTVVATVPIEPMCARIAAINRLVSNTPGSRLSLRCSQGSATFCTQSA